MEEGDNTLWITDAFTDRELEAFHWESGARFSVVGRSSGGGSAKVGARCRQLARSKLKSRESNYMLRYSSNEGITRDEESDCSNDNRDEDLSDTQLQTF